MVHGAGRQRRRPLAVSDTNDDESPSFAPNGRLLIYATRSQGRDVLMTSTLDGRIRTRLLSSGRGCARAGLGAVWALSLNAANLGDDQDVRDDPAGWMQCLR